MKLHERGHELTRARLILMMYDSDFGLEMKTSDGGLLSVRNKYFIILLCLRIGDFT